VVRRERDQEAVLEGAGLEEVGELYVVESTGQVLDWSETVTVAVGSKVCCTLDDSLEECRERVWESWTAPLPPLEGEDRKAIANVRVSGLGEEVWLFLSFSFFFLFCV
jgi:hypothetical protein